MEKRRYESLDECFYEDFGIGKKTFFERISGAKKIIAGVALGTILVSGAITGAYLTHEGLNFSDLFNNPTISNGIDENPVPQPGIEEENNLYEYDENIDLESFLSIYNMTKEEFDVLAKVILSESLYNTMEQEQPVDEYKESFAVTTTLLNRISSTRYKNAFGSNLYAQVTAPNQFYYYANGVYKEFDKIAIETLDGYRAILDCLYSFLIDPTKRMHSCCSFRNQKNGDFSLQFTEHGSYYGQELIADEIIYPDFLESQDVKNIKNNIINENSQGLFKTYK